MTMGLDHHGSILMLFKLSSMTYVYGSRLRLQVYADSQDIHGLGNIRTASWVGPVRRLKQP
jgi:hypothetical protein